MYSLRYPLFPVITPFFPVLYHEKLNLIEHQILIQGLKQSFSTFQVRYDICQLLNKEDFTFEELSHIDAFPKSLLLSIE